MSTPQDLLFLIGFRLQNSIQGFKLSQKTSILSSSTVYANVLFVSPQVNRGAVAHR